MDRRSLLFATAAGLAAGTGLAPRGAAAQAANVHRTPVGALEVLVVHDGFVVRPDVTTGFIPGATREQILAALQAVGETGPAMQNPYNVTFVKGPRGLIIFDAGTGGISGPQTGTLVANMRAAGLDPAQVTQVIQTHFHPDHIGGLTTQDGTPVFANATVHVPAREWAFWLDEGEESRAAESRRANFALARRRFAAYQGKVSTFQPGAEVAPGITAVATPGHSPGHTSFLVADGGQQLMVIGDAVTTPAFFMFNPEWFPVLDMDPAQAVETRKRLLDRLATDRIPVTGYHFPMPATGRIERAGSGYRLVPAGA
jgi:glyoxylase-like metal-dependent hydrolase (beta-lactamase superfamily II)